MIQRKIEDSIIQELSREKSKIILLYGARQIGKTTLVNKIISNYQGKILKINADEQPHWDVLSSRDSAQLRAFVEGYDLLFIDEAQRIPDIGINLKILYENCPQLKIIATGSSSLDLANRVKEPLTGRAWTFEMYPIAVSEWKDFSNANSYEMTQAIESFLRFGMYPEVFAYPNDKQKERYLKEIASSYLYKDILALADIKYPDKLLQLLRLLAFQLSSEVSIHELSKALQIHRDAINNYIDLLEKAFVIFRVGGFSRNLRKEVTKMDKIYFYDTGIRNAIINNFSPLSMRNDTGMLWENFLISERIKRNTYTQHYANYYFWRTYDNAEIDWVEDAGGQLSAFEFKWNKKKNKAPASWTKAYPDAQYQNINKDNFMGFVE